MPVVHLKSEIYFGILKRRRKSEAEIMLLVGTTNNCAQSWSCFPAVQIPEQ